MSGQLTAILKSPVRYRPKQGGGGIGMGYPATALPDICGVVMDASDSPSFRDTQGYLLASAKMLLKAFAKVGVIALVDEATGYQADRVRDELQKILAAYIAEEMQPYVKKFPVEFFRQVYRLQGWEFKEGRAARPGYVGKLINEWIYDRLPSPVLPKLQELNPSENGRRKHKHHQFLTEDTGVPNLDKQIASVTALMRAARNLSEFDRMVAAAFPKRGDQGTMNVDEPDDA